MKAKIDWINIKKDYIQGITENGKRTYPSQRDLIAKYGVSNTALANRCKKENWLTERQIVSSKINARQEQKTIEQISDKGVEFDLACFKDAQKIREKLNEILDSITKDDPYAIKKLNAVGYGITTAQGIGKKALGEDKQLSNLGSLSDSDLEKEIEPNS